MNLNFNNTEIAFRHKSDHDLWQAKKLFQLFSNTFLVNRGPGLAIFGINIGLPIKGLIKRTIFHQFCGGETVEASFPSANELQERGVNAILDYSVEGEGDTGSYESCFKELLNVIEFCSGKDAFPFSVFKVTGIADAKMLTSLSSGKELNEKDKIEKEGFERRIKMLCSTSASKGLPIMIDAEESWIQDPIDDICYQNMKEFNTEEAMVYNTIQLYRKNRLPGMKQAIEDGRRAGYKIGFKLVRGAYMEKEAERALKYDYENPIQDSKEATDRDYDEAVKLCFDNRDIVSICAGTHNEESSYLLAELLDKENIQKDDKRFWFAQLYGMSDHISFNLAHAGYNVVKYLPYGPVKEVLPYLSRRAKENSSVKGQAGRELNLIDQEINRRKHSES